VSESKGDMRAAVEAAVLAELERVGPDALVKADIARPFAGKGASTATLYRWIDGVLKTGRGGQYLAGKIKAAAEERAKAPDPPAAAAEAAAASLPAVVTMEDVASSGVIPVIERMVKCIEIADQLIKHARTEEGEVRSAKLLLNASEHMRRNLETAVRLQESIRQTNDVSRFNKAVVALIRTVAAKHPEVGEELVTGLSQLVSQWGG